jgi:hypothetical protein
MIFDAFGSYDLAWRVGVLIGIIAGVVQIVFGGPRVRKAACGRCWPPVDNEWLRPPKVAQPRNGASARPRALKHTPRFL